MKLLRKLAVFAFVISLATPVFAATTEAQADGYWHEGGTWNAGVPQAVDTAYIDNHHVVATNAGAVCTVLHVCRLQDSTGMLSIVGGTLSISNQLKVAYKGLGYVEQHTGTVSIGGIMYIGCRGSTGSGKGYYKLIDGTLTTSNMVYIGTGLDTDSILTMSNGVINCPNMTLCNGDSYNQYIQTGGAYTNTGYLTVGSNGSNAYGVVHLSGGNMKVTTLRTGYRGQGYPGSTGIITQTGGIMSIDNLEMSYSGVGEYWIYGGEMTVSDTLTLKRGGGTLAIAGGSVNINYGDNMNNATGAVNIVGSLATNITFTNQFLLNNSENKLRAYADRVGGLSTIKVLSGAVNLSGATLELGATNNCNCGIGDSWNLIRAATGQINTNGMMVTNVSAPKFLFEARVTNHDSYDWLEITCIHPPKSTTIIVK